MEVDKLETSINRDTPQAVSVEPLGNLVDGSIVNSVDDGSGTCDHRTESCAQNMVRGDRRRSDDIRDVTVTASLRRVEQLLVECLD
jgi:hypothetical protein